MQNADPGLYNGYEQAHSQREVGDSEEQSGDRAILQITLDDLIPEDIIWLEKALARDYHELTARDILDRLNREFWLWRLPAGIVVGSIIYHLHGREFFISHIAGEGALPHFPEIDKTLCAFAKAAGCRWYSALAVRKGLYERYERLGREVGRIYMREL